MTDVDHECVGRLNALQSSVSGTRDAAVALPDEVHIGLQPLKLIERPAVYCARMATTADP